MDTKKLSVIITVYNVEKYLVECLESVINQTYRELEIILVDDGSTDSSGQICDVYACKDTRIKVIHQENMGLIMARYNGVKASSNEYVTFVDGDDWIELDTYRFLSQYMLKCYDVIIYACIRYFSKEDSVKSDVCFREGAYTKEQIIDEVYPKMIWDCGKDTFGMDPSVCFKIMRQELVVKSLEAIKGLPFHEGEDVAISVPLMLEANSLFVSEQYFYYHRQRKRNELAPFIKDDQYFEKIYMWYEYLKQRLRDHNELVKQLEYAYISEVGIRKKLYGDYTSNKQYLFPFGDVDKDSRIVLYGAGVVGKTYYKQIEKTGYCKIVAWVDRKYEYYRALGVMQINYIEQIEYDYIVVANASESSSIEIKRDLINMGIEGNKIVSGEISKTS